MLRPMQMKPVAAMDSRASSSPRPSSPRRRRMTSAASGSAQRSSSRAVAPATAEALVNAAEAIAVSIEPPGPEVVAVIEEGEVTYSAVERNDARAEVEEGCPT